MYNQLPVHRYTEGESRKRKGGYDNHYRYMANVIYNSFKRDIANGSIDLYTDTIKMMLVTSAYTPDQDAHHKRDDITNEV